MPRNIEMRERVGGVFNHADSLLYPKTHINMVEGLLTNGKLSLSLLPDEIKTGLKLVNFFEPIQDDFTTTELLTKVDDYLSEKGLDNSSRDGCYFIFNKSMTLNVTSGHYVYGSENTQAVTNSGSILINRNDWLIYTNDLNGGTHRWAIINNTYNHVTTTKDGIMSFTDKVKLDGIASNANNYSHPTYTVRNVDTNGVVVLDTFTSDDKGHVTGIGTRTLPNATNANPGVMSATDKAKLDGIAESANNYSLPTASASVLGGVKVGSGLSITSGVLANSSPNATHTGDVTGSVTLTITDNAVTNAKLADMPTMTVKGNNSGSTFSPNDITMPSLRTMLNVEDGANNYSHPTQTAKSQDLTSVETLDSISFDTDGHIATLTKQAIRTGSTSQTGVLQLATGTELTTALSSTKAPSPVSVKTMIDYFAGMKRYADITAANAASHPDGAIALITIA